MSAKSAKRARLPQFRPARPRTNNTPSQCSTHMSSIVTVQRASSGKLTTQERELERQQSQSRLRAHLPSPSEESFDISPDVEALPSLARPILKRKRVNTTKVNLF